MKIPLLCWILPLLFVVELNAADWSRFRGPDGSGRSDAKGLPWKWSASENIVWKANLPGRGASSPIIWQDRIYLTAYDGYGLTKTDPYSNSHLLRRYLLCLRRSDGNVLWKAEHGGPMKDHGMADFLSLHGYASSTAVADASGVYVYYGNAGVVAYRHDGQKKWQKELGRKTHSWGSASSPIIFEGLLLVHADIENHALLAYDKETGKEVWRVATGSQEYGDSWSTPLLVQVGGKPELVYHQSTGQPATLAAVDPRNGAPLWSCGVLKDYLVPSPIAHGGVIYAIAYQKGAAIRAGGRGDVSQSHVLWKINKGSEVCSPVYHDGHLYWTSESGGLAYCVNATTGQLVYEERLLPPPDKIYASPLLAEGRIYYPSRKNGTYVVAAKPQFELLAHNVIASDPSVFNGSPAVSGNQIFLRSDQFLYCLGTRK